jgi:beta-lactamase regulating signal transducer with metallopeptidase domain/protocatechuate 3,4-dioxygenase beta subunit
MNATFVPVDARTALLLDVALKATVVLLAALLFCLLARRASAAARHLSWSVAVYALLALPLLALVLPAWQVPLLPGPTPDAGPKAKVAAAPPADTPETTETPVLPSRDLRADLQPPAPADTKSPQPQGNEVVRPTASRPEAETPAASAAPIPWTSWVLGTWAAGALVTLAPLLLGLAGLRVLARRARLITDHSWNELVHELSDRLGLYRPVTLLRCERGTMPMTWGLLRPVILLPADADDWPAERRRLVLLHELAHVQRRDCLTQLLAQLACALYWFHPLAWLAARRLRLERENACDDQVLLSGPRASDYAFLLLETARSLRSGRCPSLATVSMAQRSQLEGRLLAVLDPNRRRLPLTRRTVGLSLLAAAALLVPLAALHPWAQAAEKEKAPPAKSAKKKESGKKVTVTGKVLTPGGKPAAEADVALLTFPKNWMQVRDESQIRFELLGQAKTDARGRFRLRAPHTVPPAELPILPGQLIVRGKGFGFGLHGLKLDADQKGIVVRLTKEMVLRGRLIDLQGEPVKGLKLPVMAVGRKGPRGIVGVMHPVQPLTFWPGPVITDKRGRFTLRGVGRGQMAALLLRDDRFAPQTLELGEGKGYPKLLKLTLTPAKVVEGRVTYADSGKPVAGAVVRLQGIQAKTDKDGRYRLVPREDIHSYQESLFAGPPEGEPYLAVFKELPKAKGAAKRRLNLTLPRGILVRGKLTEAGSGKRLAGAVVYYTPLQRDNPTVLKGLALGSAFPVRSDAKGNFRIAVPPGPGHLLAKAFAPDYVPVEIGSNVLNQGEPGGRRVYAHGVVHINVKPKGQPPQVTFRFRRGVTVSGKVVGPDGKPATGVKMVTRLSTSAPQMVDYEPRPVELNGSKFTLKGCEVGKAYPVIFFDEEHRTGTVLTVSGKQQGKPLTVKLRPWGSATARFVDAQGNPLAGYRPWVDLVLTPGTHPYRFANKGLAADEAMLGNIHTRIYPWDKAVADAKGRFTVSILIPGVTYRLYDPNSKQFILRDVTVKPGEKKDLGDIVKK